MPKNKKTTDNSLDNIRHSLAHILAAAVLKKYPKTKLGIGPVIENGFYYDFQFKEPISAEVLPELEKEMRRFINEHLPFSGKPITPVVAKKLFSGQTFKLDLIKDFTKEKLKMTAYKTGDIFVDLCRGGHVKNTKEINPEAFKLTHLAGAYWKGDEKKAQLTRIYGLAFKTKKELEEHLAMLEEAKKRDHRLWGEKLKLFTIDEMVGKGLPLWLPNGTIMRDEVEKFAKEMEEKYEYKRVVTPHIAKKELFLTSGHLPYYESDMYPAMKMDDGTYYLRAMNCPHHHIIYRSEPRSYRDLPLRLAEYGTVYRNELSGTLAGLLRVRMLSMNDAHIYCRKDQIEEEMGRVLKMTMEYFKIFNLNDYWFRLSKWDPKNKAKYINEPTNWKFAEGVLRNVLKKSGAKFTEASDEAAFYGPKIDVQFKSVIGREETMSTIQLDFAAKKRFGLTYRDEKGKNNNEVFTIHRAPLSTHERFMAFLIEHYAGAFPTWLAPVQVQILPISEKFSLYGTEVWNALKAAGIRAELTEMNESLGKRIREGELQKIPYLLIVGEKEQTEKTVSIRSREKGQVGTKELRSLIDDLTKEIRDRH
ncbi:MAG: threonine--tRNA ligase [Anaplasmataceae bacterium]|nr:threonine--tRNA ligase [Anaplasmataceae bacterium]